MTTPSETTTEIVPIAANELEKPNQLLEELNFVKIEGRYFCFDHRGLQNRKGVFEYRDGNRGLVVELNDRFGHPGPLAYKIVQSVFRKITEEGAPFPGTVSFSKRELGRWIGRDLFGGRDSKDIYKAIRQLEDTRISLVLYGEKGNVVGNPLNFRFLIDTAFIGEGMSIDAMHLSATKLTVHPIIVESMRQNHFVIFNWDRLSLLEPLTAALYKRLYLHFSNLYENQYDRASLRFEKDYEQMCGEWLGGLAVQKYKSRITQQLEPHLKILLDRGLLRSATVEKRADGNGFKISFRPGRDFFVDYEHFYHRSKVRVLQFQHTSDQFQIQKPLELAAYFYKRLKGVDTLETNIFSAKDTDFLRDIEAQFGDEGVRDLIDYAVAEAPKTKFAMQTVHAIKQYIPAWQAEKDKRATVRERQRLEAAKRAEEHKQLEYEQFIKAEIHYYIDSLSSEERASLTERAAALVDVKHPKGSPVYSISVRIAERQLIQEAHPLPSFEEWKTSRS